MARKDAKGRTVGRLGRYVALPHYLLESLAWRNLSSVAQSAYVEILRRYNGCNNGRLAMSARVLATARRISRATATRALQELVSHGFLEVVRPGGFSCKVKRAAEYRETFHPCDVTGALPSKAFIRWRPKIHSSASPGSNDGSATEQESRKAA